MADKDIRYYLIGTLLYLRGNELIVAATDGHRVAEAVATLESATAAADTILPRKCALELHGLLAHSDEPVRLRVQPKQAAFRFGQVELITAAVDGQFPNYQRAFPESFDQRFRVDRAPFTQALTRVRILAEQKHQGIHWCSSGGRLCMVAANGFQEDAEEMLLVECNGEAVDTGFNVNYLIDGLDSAGGEKVECALVRSPGGLQIRVPGSAQFRYFVMSMRV
jgi:DNA polymerase-3 subunit beta